MNRYIRKQFSTLDVLKPHLLECKLAKFETFLQKDVPSYKRELVGIHSALSSVFPLEIDSGFVELSYVSYRLEDPYYTIPEVEKRGLTYSSSIYVIFRCTVYDRDYPAREVVKTVQEQEVYFGEVPIMSENATFWINGSERIVVFQLHKSPGFYLEVNNYSGDKPSVFYAKIQPSKGCWVTFILTKNKIMCTLDKSKQIPATLLLKAFGLKDKEILDSFAETETYYFSFSEPTTPTLKIKFKLPNLGDRLEFDIVHKNVVYGKKHQKVTKSMLATLSELNLKRVVVSKDYLIGKHIATPISLPKVDLELNDVVTESIFNSIKTDLKLTVYSNTLGNHINNTLLSDDTNSSEKALYEIHTLLYPTVPATEESVQLLFYNLFANPARYDLTKVGRENLNSKVGLDKTYTSTLLRSEDLIGSIKELIKYSSSATTTTDLDGLDNRKVVSVSDMLENQFKVGILKMVKQLKERMLLVENNSLSIGDIFHDKTITSSMRDFFNSSSFSQFLDQLNPLAQISHNRRLTSLGPGGLSKERASLDVRDVHPSHYGRLCPIETPEGSHIGLVNSLSLYAKINSNGFIETPFRIVEDRKITDNVVWLSAAEEKDKVFATLSLPKDQDGLITNKYNLCRKNNNDQLEIAEDINYVDYSYDQIVSVGCSLIPFMENDDTKRALMGANMQRQALPLLIPQAPLVGTGMEKKIAYDSGSMVLSKQDGIVKYVDASKIIVSDGTSISTYKLIKNKRTNQSTCITQKPIVKEGDTIKKGDILADGQATKEGELSLGQNLLVALMPWNGYNFEDSVIISEKIVQEDRLTSIHIEEYECVARITKDYVEEITSDIPNVSSAELAKLDLSGIISVGQHVKPGDLLVGKVTPKESTPLTAEEKLIFALFGDKAAVVKDSSLRAPSKCSGVVIKVEVQGRNAVEDSTASYLDEKELEDYKQELDDEHRILRKAVYSRLESFLHNKNVHLDGTNKVLTRTRLREYTRNSWVNFRLVNKEDRYTLKGFKRELKALEKHFSVLYNTKKKKVSSSAGLPANVSQIVKVYVAVKKQVQAGDKVAGRHGNKGVISMVKPVEDMPYLKDGTPIDIVLNPLGVPSRMNVGQVLELYLGYAAKGLGDKISSLLESEARIKKIRKFLHKIYEDSKFSSDLNSFEDSQILELAAKLVNGVPMETPIFDSAKEHDIRRLIELADLPISGQEILYDGLTGEEFERPVTVGVMYIMKLNHLVVDKMHARSTGPYSMITQQPLGGKALHGGQRFGEMEVWALEAYGAAYTLKEMLTVKSDDVSGRADTYKNILRGEHDIDSSLPESFHVILQELRALALNVNLDYNRTGEQ